jgi:hypothetical protein
VGGVREADAVTTWDALSSAGELVTVTVGRLERSLLALDATADALLDGVPDDDVVGVRLLPQGDPYLARDRAFLVDDEHAYASLFEPQKETPGGILMDGGLVGTWSRQQHRVTLRPWRALPQDDVARVDAAAASFAGPLGRQPDVRWVAP